MADNDRDILLTGIEMLTLATKRDLLKAVKERLSASPSATQLAALSYAYAMLEGANIGVLPGTAPPETK
jgi:hypothetical protein